MKGLRKAGGIAAIYEAAAYLVGIVGYLVILDYTVVRGPMEKVSFLLENMGVVYALTLFVYVVFGVALVVLSLALHDRLKEGAQGLMQVATVFGLVWATLLLGSGMIYNVGLGSVALLYETDPARAATVWAVIEAISNGLGGEYEILGGLWTLLVSVAALRSGAFGRIVNYVGLVLGLAGIVSVVPPITEAAVGVFALGHIIWFVWIGILLIRGTEGSHSAG